LKSSVPLALTVTFEVLAIWLMFSSWTSAVSVPSPTTSAPGIAATVLVPFSSSVP
jgi:hypothetical protein